MTTPLDVRSYWSLPLEEQERVKDQAQVESVYGLHTRKYHVEGVLTVEAGPEYCECEYCEGHDTQADSHFIDTMVLATSREDAVQALELSITRAYDSVKATVWSHGPFVMVEEEDGEQDWYSVDGVDLESASRMQ